MHTRLPDVSTVRTMTLVVTILVVAGCFAQDTIPRTTAPATNPVAITCQPFAQPNPAIVGQPVTFVAAATGNGAITYSWNFGDYAINNPNGTTSAANPATVTYQSAGGFPVELTVTDAQGNTTGTFFSVIVTDKTIDTDGDGVPDAIKTVLGENPVVQAEFGRFLPSFVTKSKIKLSAQRPGKDSLIFSLFFSPYPIYVGSVAPGTNGIIPQVNGQKAVVYFGGIVREFSLSQKGVRISGTPSDVSHKNDHVTFTYYKKSSTYAATFSLSGNNFKETLSAGATLTPSTLFPVFCVIGNQLYGYTQYFGFATSGTGAITGVGATSGAAALGGRSGF